MLKDQRQCGGGVGVRLEAKSILCTVTVVPSPDVQRANELPTTECTFKSQGEAIKTLESSFKLGNVN